MGTPIVIIAITNTFKTAFLYLLCLPKLIIATFFKQKGAMTRKEIIDTLIGPEFDIRHRYFFVITNFFIIITFSAGFPIIYPILACGLVLLY